MKRAEHHLYNISTDFKRHIISAFLSLFLLTILFNSSVGVAQETATETKKDVFRLLEEEKTKAENSGYILNLFKKEGLDLKKYAGGIQLYAKAQAEFNGLIVLMSKKLIENEPYKSSDFDSSLKTAVDKRISFTKYTEQIIGGSEGKKGLLPDPVELVKVIIDSVKTFWQEYHAVKETRRQELRDQLDSLKWKSFHEIGGGE